MSFVKLKMEDLLIFLFIDSLQIYLIFLIHSFAELEENAPKYPIFVT